MLEHLERQRSLTTNQWKIFAAATIGDMLDFFDFYLIGFILAFMLKGWDLTYGQSGQSCCPRASPLPWVHSSGAGWPTRSAGGR